MYVLAIDCETYPFAVGYQLPKPVCLQMRALGIPASIVRGDDIRAVLADALSDNNCFLTGHGIAYDMGCCAMEFPELYEPIMAAYEGNRILCTMVHAQLADFAVGARGLKYALDKVCKRWDIDPVPDKENPWRVRYGELDGVPTKDWPAEAIKYALDDVEAAFNLSMELTLAAPVPDVPAQSRYAYWLKLSSALGMKTDQPAVAQWQAELETDIAQLEPQLTAAGIIGADGKKKMAAIRERMVASGNARKTQKGNVVTDALACEESGDPLLQSFASFNKLKAAYTRELPMFKEAYVHTYYSMAATTRSTSSNPNMQNLSTASGSRGCVMPREGMTFVVFDFSILELCCLAELCLVLNVGDTLANVLIAGDDPHRSMSAELLDTTYADAPNHPDYKRTRQRLSKEANYGFPGGMGAAGMVRTAAKRGTKLTLAQAASLKRSWAKQWPEIPKYQRVCRNQVEGNNGMLEHYFSRHVRGGLRYTQACNSPFQSLGAVVTKRAGWELTRANYLPSLFVHDEYVVEVPIPKAEVAAREIETICETAAREVLPRVGCKGESIVSMKWVKP